LEVGSVTQMAAVVALILSLANPSDFADQKA